MLVSNVIQDAIEREITQADDAYGPFASTHEGLGVLEEEYYELRRAIHRNTAADIRAEAIQVAAVAIRIARSLSNADTRRRSGL